MMTEDDSIIKPIAVKTKHEPEIVVSPPTQDAITSKSEIEVIPAAPVEEEVKVVEQPAP